ncbi:MAG: aminotransferase class V-fold PLP-dependent enzyme [Thermoflexaceae bacterium]|nr:aminotransferase class V-fold PLP-dependent enzyme [Thermoflexaceae bacterium]
MLNFTVGPVQESDEILGIGSQQTPYFRNQSFSKIMLENEAMMKELSFAEENARVVFLTASGTGAMEAAVMNCFSKEDNVLVVDGGGFGHRFVQLCEIHEVPHTVVKVPFESALTKEMLEPYNGCGYTGFLINMHETSIGKLYDMKLVADFCKKNSLFLVVDAISAFLADSFNMSELGADVMITGSQKALAVPPGISILVLSEKAVDRVTNHKVKSMYFNLADALKNGERGQTPFTPAVSILLQIHARLKQLCEYGAEAEIKRIAELAEYFRSQITDLPLKIASPSLSNAVTPLMVDEEISAYEIFETLERDYGIWVCPSGGELKDKLFRVGHIGCLEKRDYDKLVDAMKQIFSNK